jgi:hypothetical protein
MSLIGQLQATNTLKAEDKQDKQWAHKSKNKARPCSRSSRAKAKSVTYSEFVSVALVIQHAMRMRYIVHCHLFPV